LDAKPWTDEDEEKAWKKHLKNAQDEYMGREDGPDNEVLHYTLDGRCLDEREPECFIQRLKPNKEKKKKRGGSKKNKSKYKSKKSNKKKDETPKANKKHLKVNSNCKSKNKDEITHNNHNHNHLPSTSRLRSSRSSMFSLPSASTSSPITTPYSSNFEQFLSKKSQAQAPPSSSKKKPSSCSSSTSTSNPTFNSPITPSNTSKRKNSLDPSSSSCSSNKHLESTIKSSLNRPNVYEVNGIFRHCDHDQCQPDELTLDNFILLRERALPQQPAYVNPEQAINMDLNAFNAQCNAIAAMLDDDDEDDDDLNLLNPDEHDMFNSVLKEYIQDSILG
jgi:hypothetical protein